MKFGSLFIVLSCFSVPAAAQLEALQPIIALIAPFIQTFFNLGAGLFSDLLFSGALSEGLSELDPLSVDFLIEQSLGSFDIGECGNGEVSAAVTVASISGFSSVSVSQLEISTLEVNNDGLAMDIAAAAGISSLVANYAGSLTHTNADCSVDFTGNATLAGASFTFAFDANMTLFSGIAINSANVSSLEIVWEEVDVYATGLGDFQDIFDELEATIVTEMSSLVSENVNADLMNDAFAGLLPIVIIA